MTEKLVAIILRGAPGAGKSTWVKTHSDFLVVSTDAYFINSSGEYVFERSKLGYYHRLALEEFRQRIDDQSSPLVLDNTNIKMKEYKDYVDYAQEAGYTIFQKVFTGTYTSIHDVPEETIERMRSALQEDINLPHLVEEYYS